MSLSYAELVEVCEVATEATRLRIVALLDQAELTVSELTDILRQSQPRVSRHLKLLVDAEIVRRTPEGSWAFYRLARSTPAAQTVAALLGLVDRDDHVLAGDRARLDDIRGERAEASKAFFAEHAAEWEQLRRLHVGDERVDEAIVAAIAGRGYRSLLDLGTGTGRLLEVVGPKLARGVGIDRSREMLALARQRLEGAGLRHCTVRHGDIYDLGYPAGTFDVVVIQQVLHLLDDPAAVVREAARVLAPAGGLLVVDFAPHDNELLRTEFAHRRLGFDRQTVARWMTAAGLGRVSHETVEAEDEHTIAVSLWHGHDRRPAAPVTRREETIR